MRKISLWILSCAFTAVVAFGQSAAPADDATQEQINKLSGQVQDLLDAQAAQNKRMEELAKAIGELRDKVNAPATVSDSASADDLKKLAQQLQEIDQKRVADNEKIMTTLAKLGTATARSKPAPPVTPMATANDTPPPGSKQNGYEYQVKSGDTLSGIAKACRDQGVKVTTAQIQAANPKLDPTKLYVGQKIFIPDANAK